MQKPLKSLPLLAIDLRPFLTPFESGVTVYLAAMVREIKKAGIFDLDLFYQARKKSQRISKIFPEARFIPCSNTIFHLKCLFGLPALPSKYFPQRPDAIWLPDRLPFYRSKIPLFMTIHDFVPEEFSGTLSFKSLIWHKIFSLHRLLGLCSGVLVPSLSIGYSPRIKGIPSEVTYEGANLLGGRGKRPNGFNLGKGDFFLSISPMDPRKRLKWVFFAAEKFPRAHFVIAGNKQEDKRFRFFRRPTLPNLHFLGEITEEEKLWLLKNAVALLALSEYEGFDLPVLEAVKAKCQVIMSGIPVHIELYKRATVVNSADELFGAIYLALQNKKYVKKLLIRPRGKYTWEGAAKRASLFFLRVLFNKN